MKLKGTICAAVVALASIFTGATPGAAQHIIGGGDPLMMIFSEGKYEAGRMLENLQLGSLPSGAAAVRDWLAAPVMYREQMLVRHQAMALEMARSVHSWKDGDVGFDKCAVIRLDPAEEPLIDLSLSRCRHLFALSPAGGGEAVKTLLHEISHRFGLTTSDVDEAFASAVAVAVFNSWANERRGGKPFWTNTNEMLSPRFQPTGVWTGAGNGPASNQLIIWGGCNENPLPGTSVCQDYLKSGGRLVYRREGPLGEPPQTEWLTMDDAAAPVGRKLHTAIWTGDKMLVYGGCRGDDIACNQSLNDAATYDPATNQWQLLATAGAPSARVFHGAAWTSQDELIVWGGLEGYQSAQPDRILGDGGILSFPEDQPTGSWRPLPAGNGSPAARYGHTALWTGTEFLVWGGCGQVPGVTRCVKPLNDGAFYNPHPENGQPAWRPLRVRDFVTPRTNHSAIWTGRYLIVWGGLSGVRVLSDGAVYDSQTGDWTPISSNLPAGETGRRDHSASFEPLQGRMIVWGGVSGDGKYPSRTLIYDIATNRWDYAGTETDPVGREGQVATWIQDSLFVWGGYNKDNGFLSQGGIFNP